MDPVTFPNPQFKPGDILVCATVGPLSGRVFTKGAEYRVRDDGTIASNTGHTWGRPNSLCGTTGPSVKFFRKTPTRIEAAPSEDIVNRPAHYTRWAIEPVEFLMRNRVEGHLFNIVKYAMRAGYKLYPGKDATESEITDLEKVIRYSQMRINLLKGADKL